MVSDAPATTGPGEAPTWPRRGGRLGTAVLANLVGQVVNGELPAGSQLPPEPALCEAFGVSRTVIRESLKLLEEKGLVRVRQGQGTTVQPIDQWNLLDPVVLDAAVRDGGLVSLVDDLVVVRSALESRMARLAAERITEDELHELRAQVARLEEALAQPERYVVLDLEFHDLIARFSGNRVSRQVIRSLQPYLQANALYNPRARVPEDDVFAQTGHLEILERIAGHDADGAARAAEEHVASSWNRQRQKHTPRTRRR